MARVIRNGFSRPWLTPQPAMSAMTMMGSSSGLTRGSDRVNVRKPVQFSAGKHDGCGHQSNGGVLRNSRAGAGGSRLSGNRSYLRGESDTNLRA